MASLGPSVTRFADVAPLAERVLSRIWRRRKYPLVLIVDDDPATRMLCSMNLGVEGVVVLEAGDGRHALRQARSRRPDLVVTDVMMPGIDGFQLAEALRQDVRTSQIPIIFVSGEAEQAVASRARELGALGFLRKPFDAPAFAALVAAALPASQVSRQMN